MSSNRPHPEDGVLLRILDGELVETDAQDHLATCADCGRRIETLSRRSDRLEEMLRAGDALIDDPTWDPDFLSRLKTASDAGSGRRRWSWLRTPTLRWAAAVALLTALVSVTPARAWMVRGAEAAWTWITDAMTDRGTPGPSERGAGPTEVVTSITGRVLTVRLSGPVTPDSVVFRAGREDRARAMLRDGGEEAELLVRTDGFQVRPSRGGATLDVWVPASVAEVRVMRNGEELARRSRGEDLGWGWRLAIFGGN